MPARRSSAMAVRKPLRNSPASVNSECHRVLAGLREQADKLPDKRQRQVVDAVVADVTSSARSAVDFPAPGDAGHHQHAQRSRPSSDTAGSDWGCAELDESVGLGPAAAWKLWPTGHHLTWRQQSA